MDLNGEKEYPSLFCVKIITYDLKYIEHFTECSQALSLGEGGLEASTFPNTSEL